MSYRTRRIIIRTAAALGVTLAAYLTVIDAQARADGHLSTVGMGVWLLGFPVSLIVSFVLAGLHMAIGTPAGFNEPIGIFTLSAVTLGANFALWAYAGTAIVSSVLSDRRFRTYRHTRKP